MLFERLKVLFFTLRFRLMLWNAGAVLATAVVTLVAVREGVRYALQHEMDYVMLEDAREVGIAIDELGIAETGDLYEELNRKARGHAQHEWFVRLIDENHQVLWSSYDAPPISLAPSTGDLPPATMLNYRIVQRLHTLPDGTPITIRIGSSLVYLQRDLERIDRQVVIAAAIMFVIAPLGGYWLAGRTTRILSNIIRTTARLRPRKLEERLPIRNTGDELDQLARTVNRLLDRIAHYLAQKRDFLANAAHELRTPLAAIRSSIEVALGGDRSREEYEELLSELIDQCSSLEVLVNQLLLLAETESDRIKIQGEAVALDEIVRRSVEMFRGVAEYQEIELTTNDFPHVVIEGNSPHLRQVLNNLLDNALKFTPAGGGVRVELERSDEQQQVTLRVTDTGAGIPPHDLPHVFERFYRGDKSRQREGVTRSTGLGLSICHAVVTAHGGRISVRSTLGQGTTFSVVLPLLQNLAPLGAA